ncbi:MAG: hypothetical protein HY393_00165 [Candidatus Diapherotrites archaeon]|nr:hypothetical protein [Candidatus Diapherotrites archaeon]
MDKRLKIAGLFVLSYLLLYALAAFVDALKDWDSFLMPLLRGESVSGRPYYDPLYLIAPFIGFFLMYYGIDWVNRWFDTTLGRSVFFPAGFLVMAYAVYFSVLVAYFNNAEYFRFAGQPNALQLSLQSTVEFVMANFFRYFLESAFFVFSLAAVLGWIAHWLVEKQ